MNDLDRRLSSLVTSVSTLRSQIEALYTKLQNSVQNELEIEHQLNLINSYRYRLLKNVDGSLVDVLKRTESKKLLQLCANYNMFNIEPNLLLLLVYQLRLKTRHEFGFYEKLKYFHLDAQRLEPVYLSNFASQRTFSIINLSPGRYFIYNYTLREFGLYVVHTNKSKLACVRKIRLRGGYHFLQQEFQNSKLIFNLTTSNRNERVYIYVFDTELNLVSCRLMKNKEFISYRAGSQCIFYRV
jgi:hypothetical protein